VDRENPDPFRELPVDELLIICDLCQLKVFKKMAGVVGPETPDVGGISGKLEDEDDEVRTVSQAYFALHETLHKVHNS
jgi:hypothetical protein